jgi:hypothetical protein
MLAAVMVWSSILQRDIFTTCIDDDDQTTHSFCQSPHRDRPFNESDFSRPDMIKQDKSSACFSSI